MRPLAWLIVAAALSQSTATLGRDLITCSTWQGGRRTEGNSAPRLAASASLARPLRPSRKPHQAGRQSSLPTLGSIPKGWPLRANSGHPRTPWRTGQIEVKRPLLIMLVHVAIGSKPAEFN
jgi:hypothetical protein